MCRNHRCLTACLKQHRQNESAGQVDIPARVEIHMSGNMDMCRDNRCLTTCEKSTQTE